MRYFLSGRQPPVGPILLVESGSLGLLEALIPGLRRTWGDQITIDVVTCYPGLPAGLSVEKTRVYRVTDFRGRAARKALVRQLVANRYSHLAVICSGEPVMSKWKWLLTCRIPAKLLILNENGDYFWADREHLNAIRQMAFYRSGLAGAGAVRTVVRLLSFPLTLLYLLLYASVVHTRRAFRRS